MNSFKDILRASPWLAITLIGVVGLSFYAPHQVGLLAWTLCKISMGAFVGYWIDRSIFYYARPLDLESDKEAFLSASNRRALIMSSTIIASGLGL